MAVEVLASLFRKLVVVVLACLAVVYSFPSRVRRNVVRWGTNVYGGGYNVGYRPNYGGYYGYGQYGGYENYGGHDGYWSSSDSDY